MRKPRGLVRWRRCAPMKPELRWLVPAVALTGLALLWAARFVPLRTPERTLVPRLLLNAAVSALAFATSALLVQPTVAAAMGWSAERGVGLVRLLALPPPLAAAFAFLSLDLSFYYWHRANHRLPFLWRFHNVHHIDPDLDVSTSFRFHFGEVGLSAAFRLVQITLIGVSAWTYAVYELAFHLNTIFHHSNLRLPIRLERLLNSLLVTPRMHGIHHSQVRAETESNYSVVLPWWDRLHRTLRLNVPQSRIEIGVPAYSRAEDNTLWQALSLPFRRQREYWRRPDGSAVERDPAVLGPRPDRLEE
ncbi:MAG: sterol desaturase family protein [Anaerolineales bacterium]